MRKDLAGSAILLLVAGALLRRFDTDFRQRA